MSKIFRGWTGHKSIKIYLNWASKEFIGIYMKSLNENNMLV